MHKWPFHTTPLAYDIQHTEENPIIEFRAGRLTYFTDNNGLSTEAVFALLADITADFIIMSTVLRNRAANWSIISDQSFPRSNDKEWC